MGKPADIPDRTRYNTKSATRRGSFWHLRRFPAILTLSSLAAVPPVSQRDRMSPLEVRPSLSLASIFGLRLLGMFVILPVFAIYAERLSGGDNLTLVGIA